MDLPTTPTGASRDDGSGAGATGAAAIVALQRTLGARERSAPHQLPARVDAEVARGRRLRAPRPSC